MLSDRDLQLLTACVDGELSPRQRRHVDHLLRQSEEARATLLRLEADSKQLIDLPRVAPPADLADSVLSAVAKVRRRPAPRPRPAAVRTFPVWTGWAAAAVVLVAVGLGSFLEYSASPDDGKAAASKNKDGDRTNPDKGGLVKNLPAPKEEPEKEDPDPDDKEPKSPDRDPPSKTPDKSGPIHKPIVEKPDEPVFGDGSIEPFTKLDRVEVALPTVLKLHELSKDDEARKLREQLTGRSAVRIELPAKNATRAFDRVKTALAAKKITLVIDPSAQAKLKTPQFRHDYGLFLENVTAADLAVLMAAIGELDRTAGDKKASELRFDGSLVVKATSSHDQQELATLLGVDPIRVRPAPPKPVGIDVRKPLSDQTSSQVEGVLDGKLAPRPNTSQPGLSVLMVPLGGRSRSPEVKRFLEERKPAREGTLQVFLVLRQLPS